MAKRAISAEEHRFGSLGDAHKHARHCERYVHRTYLVWVDKGGLAVAAPASVEHLEHMLAEMDDAEDPVTYCGGIGTIINRDIGEIMLANHRRGVLC